MSFKCTIPGVSLKVFGRAIQSLSKIGDELYFEPREDGLFLRSVNSSRSAYACFQFSPSFFDHYVDVSAQDEAEEEETFRCKIGMKSVMTVFRNLSNIDKTVEKCRVSLNTSEDRLVFQMYCRHGIIKTHKLAFIECETLQAVSSKDLCPNKITSLPKLLCDAVMNFQANQEEIILIVRPDFLALQNYVDDDQDVTKVMRTELTLSPDEFDQYQVGVDTDITFCLKELRAILAFADITNLPVTLHFEGAGRPITFSITGDLSYEGTFVLATLAEVEASNALPSQSQGQMAAKSSRKQVQGQSSRQNGHVSAVREKSHHPNARTEREEAQHGQLRHDNKNMSNSSKRRENVHKGDQEMSLSFAVEDASITDASSFMQPLGGGRSETRNPINCQETKAARHDNQIRMNDNASGDMTQSSQNGPQRSRSRDCGETSSSSNANEGVGDPTSCDNRLNSQQRTSFPTAHEDGQRQSTRMNELDTDSLVSPVIPIQNTDFSAIDDLEEDEDEVPATPPSKKFRSVFFGTQSSTQPSQSQSKAEILAPNSDDDD